MFDEYVDKVMQVLQVAAIGAMADALDASGFLSRGDIQKIDEVN